ncbi:MULTISPECIES: ParB/RepB/Spo0J family partition protein [Aeromonas]|uniref:ParB/RepB/Spo0J family partition protein n=1 Tax=Aeromonas TaxID=642 RepID=UPI003F3797EE
MAKGISLLGSGQNKSSTGGVPSENMFIPRACDGKSLADLPLNRVHPDPQQPRTWTEDELDELQAKIEGAGKILQPITVIPQAGMPGHYLIKTGEGRWRVAGRLGWEFIPSVIEDIRVNSDTRQVFADQILENIGRVGMNPMDIARSIERYMNDFEPSLTGKEAAVMLGLNETKISRYRKLLTANEDIQEITPQLTNINTLGYLIDLSRLDDVAYRDSFKKIKSGELVNAEKYLKDLVADIKNPEKNKVKKKKGNPGNDSSPRKKDKDNSVNNANEDDLSSEREVLPQSIIDGIWDDGMTSELNDAPLISTMRGVGADGVAFFKLMQANGDAISFKLDYENQIKLRWLLNKCLD